MTLKPFILTTAALLCGVAFAFAGDAPRQESTKPSPEDVTQIQISNLNIQIGKLQSDNGGLQQRIGYLSQEIIRLTTCLKAGWSYAQCGNWSQDGMSVDKIIPPPPETKKEVRPTPPKTEKEEKK